MRTINDGGRSMTLPPVSQEPAGDRILLKEVLALSRQHPPIEKPAELAQPSSLNHCLVLRDGNIKSYRWVRELRWVDFEELLVNFKAQIKRQRETGKGARFTPFHREDVFAPVKVVIADRPNPLRAVLTYESIYPYRGWLGTPHEGVHIWLAYAAVGVLNSRMGQLLYHKLHGSILEKAPAPDRLARTVLEQMPVAKRTFRKQELHLVAQLVCQIGTLYEAENECKASFSTQIRDLEDRLGWAVEALLGLREEDVRAIEDAPQSTQWPLIADSELLGRIPALPPVKLLSSQERERLASLEAISELGQRQAVEFHQLKLRRYWEEVLVDCLPLAVYTAPHREAA